ncbi:MAG: hypothetical protein KUL82_01630 [Bdellovibrio sp.]|nr:hypothetical protein [Bdellovibrio sp.]
MKTNKITLLFLLGGLLMTAGEVFACRASRDMKHSFALNFDEAPAVRVYGDGVGSTLLPQTIDKCTESAGKFLMLSKGVFMPGLVSDVADISLDGEIPNDKVCRIENPIFSKPLDHNQKKSLVKRQHQFLKECTFITVAEMSGRPLRYNAFQPFCKVTNMGASMVQMEGDYCFLQINPSYNLAISMGLKSQCANLEKMRELGLEFGDIEASLNSYVTGDDTGMSTEVDPIGSSRYRFTLQAPKNFIPLSDDLGMEAPRFPATYEAEMNIGELRFRPSGSERVDLDMYLSVDNMNAPFCKEGLCAGASTYNIPVAAEIEIYRIDASGKKSFVDGWTTGGIAQGNWKGLLRLPQHTIDGEGFKAGDNYKVIVTMYDPFEDFYIFLSQAEQFLIDLKGANGVAGLDSIPSLQALTNLTGLPSLMGLPDISSGDINSDLEMSLSYFKKLGATRLWPTYYSKICDPSHGSCLVPGKQKFWNRFTANFQIGGMSSAGIYDLKKIHVVKESPMGIIMDRQVPTLPRYSCEP